MTNVISRPSPRRAGLRRPRADYESRAIALDRNELGALLVAAGLGPPLEHALISLFALNWLRVSEAGAQRGACVRHRVYPRYLLAWLGPILADVFEVPSHKAFGGALVMAHDRGEQWPVFVG